VLMSGSNEEICLGSDQDPTLTVNDVGLVAVGDSHAHMVRSSSVNPAGHIDLYSGRNSSPKRKRQFGSLASHFSFLA